MERRSPTGIARERETRPNNPAPHQSHAYKPTHRQPRRITGHGAPVSDRHRAGARNPPQQPRPPPISRLQTHASPTAQNHGTWSAGLRPASRGSAKPAPTTPPPANLTPTNPRIANRAESRDMERRSPTGIARERETRTNDPAPHQSHACKPTHRQPRRITGHGAPVSDRHRAAARNPHQRPSPPTSGQSSRWGPARAGLRPAPGPSVRGFPH